MSPRLIVLAVVGLLLLTVPARAQEAQEAPEGSRGGGDLTLGAAGIPGREEPLFPDFDPLPDRWRIEPPPYQLTVPTSLWDPYNRNPLKGDYPIPGTQTIFPRLTLASKTVIEGRRFPIASGVSTENPNEFSFFGSPDSVEVDEKIAARLELIKGSTTYKPFDWQILVEGVADINSVWFWERGAVYPDVRDGTDRTLADVRLEQAFLEVHLADLSANYDFISTKIGRQAFNSDFRSLIFQDTNQGARIFGTANSGRYQYNLIYFYQAEKDVVSNLNTFGLRDQQVAIANVYIQDFFFNGWTNEFSFHYNFDDGEKAGFVYDRLGFLVRPTPIGDPVPHNVSAYYFGWASEGHIGRINVSHAFYQALGTDDFNNIAGRETDINAQLAFLELSIDDDWLRYQTSVYFTSGDDDPRDGDANGFDTILDNPKVAGGEFSFFNRQSIRITDRGGAGLNQRLSLVPDLRSNKFLGQANFVNPGLLLLNVGASAETTPTSTVIANANYIQFVDSAVLETILGQADIDETAGIDLSLGLEWRPFLNNNIIVKGFGAIFQPLDGFRQIYGGQTLWQLGTELTLVY
jgi:hypothetical protein